MEIVAGADLIPGKAAAFFKKHGVEGVKTDYASHKEMLDDKSLGLDAVSICTYNRQHAAPAIYALEKGVNVLLEKPFTVTLDEAVEVVKAERSGRMPRLARFDENMKMIKIVESDGSAGFTIQPAAGAQYSDALRDLLYRRKKPRESGRWVTSAAIRLTWCSMP